MADSRVLQIVLQARDEASQKLEALGKKAESVGKRSSDAFKSMNVNVDQLVKGLGAAGKKMTLFSGIAVGAGTLLAKGAAELDTLTEAFERMSAKAGISSDELLKALQKSSGGTISNKNLILSANRALSFGVARNTGEMVQLLEVARLKAREMGLTTTQAFNDIVTGLGRGSPLILDNLGITVKLGEAQEAYAEKLGKSTTELTANEQKMALVNAVMETATKDLEAVGELTANNADQFEQLKARTANLRDEIGARLLPHLITLIEQLQQVLQGVMLWMDENPKLTEQIVKWTVVTVALMAILGPLLTIIPAITAVVHVLAAAFLFIAANPIVLVIAGIAALIAASISLVQNWEQTKDSLLWLWDGLKTAWQRAVDFIKEATANFIQAIKDMFNSMGEAIKSAIQGAVDHVLSKIQAAQNALNALKNAARSVGGTITQSFRNLPANLGFGGARAAGGPVTAGKAYLVGEKGPEIIVPSNSGTVIPNNKLMGGGTYINVSITGNNISNELDLRDIAERVGDSIIGKLALSHRVG